MVATVAKWGNSLAVQIPQNLAKELELVEGTEIEIDAIALLAVLLIGLLSMKNMSCRG